MNDPAGKRRTSGLRRVALVDWSHLIEDYLDAIGLTFADFRDEMTGGAMFNHIDALSRVGIDTFIYAVSARTARPAVHRHRHTGALIRVFPAPAAYQAIRRVVWNPYGPDLDTSATAHGWRRPLARMCRALAPYLATPLWQTARALRQDRIDAILCQDYEHPRFDLYVALGRMLGIPVFARFIGGDFQLTPLERFTRPASLRWCAGIVAGTSREIARVQSEYRLPAAKLARIATPLDTEPWSSTDRVLARSHLGLPQHARIVVWHGRIMMHVKGLDTLLDAWDRVSSDRAVDDALLLLVGDGPDADRFRSRLARTRQVHWRPEFVNDRTVLARYVSAGDVMVLPSRHEGLPVAPVEAMAAGLPVVLSAIPAAHDLTPGGEEDGGVVVPPGDPDRLAAALLRLLGDDDLARKLGANAQRHVERTRSLDAVGAQLERFLTTRR